MPNQNPRSGRSAHDFDLHGVVGVRLIDASPSDANAVSGQLGLRPHTLDRHPDIIVRFADRATNRPLTFVGMDQAGYNQEGFFLLHGQGRRQSVTAFPFGSIDDVPEITCEHGSGAVPHLLTLINLACLAKGVLPLHASAFAHGSRSVLVTGWSKGGKTESLLGCMQVGAHYVGDEWVYLTEAGRMFGLPEPIRLWAWQLDQLPEVLVTRTPAQRAQLAAWRVGSRAAGTVARRRLPLSGVARKVAPILSRQTYLRIPPAELFGESRLDEDAQLDSVVLVESHESPETVVELAAPGEVALRMGASLAEERAAFMAHYRQFRFAFPEQHSQLVEAAHEREARLLDTLFSQRTAGKVSHPYPCDIAALGAAVMNASLLVLDDGNSPDRHDRRPTRISVP